VAQRLRDKVAGAENLRLDQLPAEVQATVKDGDNREITVDQTGKVVERDDD
jgi:hypothetical protein